ncbi:MAG: VOC family protein [Promethearchaeota archaeon]
MAYPIEFNTKDLVYISMNVADYERAKKFYQDVFNFKISFDTGIEVGWCELELPIQGVHIGLNFNPDVPVKHGTTTLGLSVKDLDKTKAYLESKGVEITGDIYDLPDMVSILNIKDSEGNKIQMIAPPRVKNEA